MPSISVKQALRKINVAQSSAKKSHSSSSSDKKNRPARLQEATDDPGVFIRALKTEPFGATVLHTLRVLQTLPPDDEGYEEFVRAFENYKRFDLVSPTLALLRLTEKAQPAPKMALKLDIESDLADQLTSDVNKAVMVNDKTSLPMHFLSGPIGRSSTPAPANQLYLVEVIEKNGRQKFVARNAKIHNSKGNPTKRNAFYTLSYVSRSATQKYDQNFIVTVLHFVVAGDHKLSSITSSDIQRMSQYRYGPSTWQAAMQRWFEGKIKANGRLRGSFEANPASKSTVMQIDGLAKSKLKNIENFTVLENRIADFRKYPVKLRAKFVREFAGKCASRLYSSVQPKRIYTMNQVFAGMTKTSSVMMAVQVDGTKQPATWDLIQRTPSLRQAVFKGAIELINKWRKGESPAVHAFLKAKEEIQAENKLARNYYVFEPSAMLAGMCVTMAPLLFLTDRQPYASNASLWYGGFQAIAANMAVGNRECAIAGDDCWFVKKRTEDNIELEFLDVSKADASANKFSLAFACRVLTRAVADVINVKNDFIVFKKQDFVLRLTDMLACVVPAQKSFFTTCVNMTSISVRAFQVATGQPNVALTHYNIFASLMCEYLDPILASRVKDANYDDAALFFKDCLGAHLTKEDEFLGQQMYSVDGIEGTGLTKFRLLKALSLINDKKGEELDRYCSLYLASYGSPSVSNVLEHIIGHYGGATKASVKMFDGFVDENIADQMFDKIEEHVVVLEELKNQLATGDAFVSEPVMVLGQPLPEVGDEEDDESTLSAVSSFSLMAETTSVTDTALISKKKLKQVEKAEKSAKKAKSKKKRKGQKQGEKPMTSKERQREKSRKAEEKRKADLEEDVRREKAAAFAAKQARKSAAQEACLLPGAEPIGTALSSVSGVEDNSENSEFFSANTVFVTATSTNAAGSSDSSLGEIVPGSGQSSDESVVNLMAGFTADESV